MNLRFKTLVIVGGTVAGLLGAVYFATRPIVLRQFSEVEQKNAIEHVNRAGQMLSIYLQDSAEKSQSFASWKEMYDYVENPNSEFTNYYFSARALQTMGVDMVFVIDNKNKVLFEGKVSSNGQLARTPSTLRSQLKADAKILTHKGNIDPKGFFWSEGNALWAMGALPITDDAALAPPRGTLIFGRHLTPQDLDSRLKTLGVATSVIPLTQLPPTSRTLPDMIEGNGGVLVRAGTTQTLAYSLVSGMPDQPPVAVLEIASPNEFSASARELLDSFALILALCGGVFIIVAMLPLERLVLSRLSRLRSHIEKLRASGDFSSRVDESGNDELSVLGANINRTIAALQQVATRQKRSEILFRQMAQIALSAGDAYFVMQKGQDFLHWHGDIDALLGYPPGGMQRTQRVWLQHIHRMDQGKVQRACSRGLHMQELVEVEFRVIRCDGEIRYWLLRGRPLEIDSTFKVGENAPRLVAVCIDITERRMAEQRLMPLSSLMITVR
jgi:PAS domain S-box-containing protein